MNTQAMLDAQDILTREQFKIRAKLIEIAAILDRIDRAVGDVDHDRRMLEIHKSLEVLSVSGSDRAARIQMIYSREFDSQWKKNLEVNER
ncbi:MAG: hypothetical protein L7T80_07815 [Arenicellales bacterium]|nr:hypothetical protein [Arenicellales bacterium]